MMRTFSNRNTKSWLEINTNCFVGGKGVSYKDDPQFSSEAKKYFQLKINNTYYTSFEYKRAVKTINYVARCKIDDKLIIVKILFFIVDLGDVFFCGQEIRRKEEWTIVNEWENSCIIQVNPNERLV